MASNPLPHFTEEQYLSLERAAETKSEFYHGEIFAMSGGSTRHARLQANLLAAVHGCLLDRPCDVFGSDHRLKIQATGLITYPDLSVVCGDIQYAFDDIKDTLINPILLAEVLSPSTESFDRGNKFFSYRQIPTLRDYLMISQSQLLVEHFHRGDNASWTLTAFTSLDDMIALPAIQIELPLRDIYRRVIFENPLP